MQGQNIFQLPSFHVPWHNETFNYSLRNSPLLCAHISTTNVLTNCSPQCV
jgi:hypothetical protein